MGAYWENATKEIQERAGDPLLRVEYDAGAAEPYVVLKWFRSYQDFEEQMRFKTWDPALVEKTLKSGRPDLFNPKTFKYNRRAMKARYEAERFAKLHDVTHAMAEDIAQTTDSATIYSSAQRTR
jgi:hypothetical protein